MIIECKRNNTILNLKEGDVVNHVILRCDGSFSEFIDEYIVKNGGLWDLGGNYLCMEPHEGETIVFNAAIFIKQTPITEEDIV